MSALDRMRLVCSLVVFACLLLAIYGLLKVASPRREISWPSPSTRLWIWTCLIATGMLSGYSLGGQRQPGRAEAAGHFLPVWVAAGLPIAAGIGLLATLVGFRIYRQYDRVAMKALKRARAGDTAGAIAELRAAMDAGRAPEKSPADLENPYAAPASPRKGSAARANTMGALHAMREEWAEAYEWFLEAERIGGHQAIYLGNLGSALAKLGRPGEAVVFLEEACSLAPADAGLSCNLGEVLLDLGRLDEAQERLATAEANLDHFFPIGGVTTKPISAEVESLREKLASALADRDRAAVDEN